MIAALTEGSLVNNQVVTDIGSLMTTVLGWITSNQILAIFFTMSLIGVAIGIFRGLRSAM